MEEIIDYLRERFRKKQNERNTSRRNIGIELKFPIVYPSGEAVKQEDIPALWGYFLKMGWEPIKDQHTEDTIGIRRPTNLRGEDEIRVETGFCKLEASLSYEENLFGLCKKVGSLCSLLRQFSEDRNIYFLGLGIHPLTPPSPNLMLKTGRHHFWNKVFSNELVYLFTITATNQVHIDIDFKEAADAVNVFNGLAAPQLALMANSTVWKGRIDSEHKAVREEFWQWWLGEEEERIGMPGERFKSLKHYVETLANLRPIYVKRRGQSIGIHHHQTFKEYFLSGDRLEDGKDGSNLKVSSSLEDFELHTTFCWHDARVSRYCTLENRVSCQQPPRELMVVPALSLGLVENLHEAVELIDQFSWAELVEARAQAIRLGLQAEVNHNPIERLCRSMLEVAEEGLRKRKLGEEVFLLPLLRRLKNGRCPADKVRHLFNSGGGTLLVKEYSI